jgi:hypothetical protein
VQAGFFDSLVDWEAKRPEDFLPLVEAAACCASAWVFSIILIASSRPNPTGSDRGGGGKIARIRPFHEPVRAVRNGSAANDPNQGMRK